MDAMSLVAVGAAATSVLGSLLVNARLRVSTAVVLAIGWITVIPLDRGGILGVILLSTVSLLCLSVLTVPLARPPTSRAAAWSAVLLFGYMLLYGIASESGLGALVFGVAILFVFMGQRIKLEDIRRITRGICVLVLVHVTLGLCEVLGVSDPLWSMNPHEALRRNELMPVLAGRASTSFSHPILFSFFMLMGLAFFIYAIHRTRSRVFWLWSLVAIAGIVLSGTRSALLVALFISAASMVFWLKYSRAWVLLGAALWIGVAVAVVGVDRIAAEVGLGADFARSSSFLHRSLVLESFIGLFGGDLGTVLVGRGPDIQAIFSGGYVAQYATSFNFFDNQFVFSMAVYGLVGLLFFAYVLAATMRPRNGLTRLLILVLAGMSFSFDTLTHLLPIVSLALAAGMAAAWQDHGKFDDIERASASRLQEKSGRDQSRREVEVAIQK